jgi:hypothetical protein
MEIANESDGPLENILAQAFPGANEKMRNGCLSQSEARAQMLGFARSIGGEVSIVFGFGSAISGSFKPYSDLDVFIVLNSDEPWKKTCSMYNGFAVEAQTIGKSKIKGLMQFARYSGRALAVSPLATGEILYDKEGNASALQRIFKQIFEQGPDEASIILINNIRAMLTSKIVEMATNPDINEQISCGLSIYEMLITLVCCQRRYWIRNDKWIPRLLQGDESVKFQEIATSYRKLLDGQPDELIALSNRVLSKSGGGLWSGHTLTLA